MPSVYGSSKNVLSLGMDDSELDEYQKESNRVARIKAFIADWEVEDQAKRKSAEKKGSESSSKSGATSGRRREDRNSGKGEGDRDQGATSR
jgi:hypothetical protein